jgi:alpha-ketoglutarate-dependent taurine dioxygenase
MVVTATRLSVKLLGHALGAEVRGADLSKPAPDDGESLLLELFDYAERPGHIYHHRWSANQLLLWDNRCTVHPACGGVPDDQIRTMQRTTVRGEASV